MVVCRKRLGFVAWLSCGETLKQPLLKFGVISDVQFADVDDGLNYHGTRRRRYRQSLETLSVAREAWEKEGVDFAVALGDLVDGKASRSAVERVEDAARSLKFPWHVAWGNHDHVHMSRETMRKFLGEDRKFAEEPDGLYYQFRPAPGVRCCVVDAFYKSVVGAAGGEKGRQKSADFLASKNPNIDRHDPRRSSAQTPGGWLRGLHEDDVRFVMFNGGFGEKQINWFKTEVLEEAKRHNEVLFVFSHVPVYPLASRSQNVAWDYENILTAIDDYDDVPLVWFCGHDHDGGFATRGKTQVYLTPPAPLECDRGQVSFGTVEVSHGGSVSLNWRGKTPHNSHHPWPTSFIIDKQSDLKAHHHGAIV